MGDYHTYAETQRQTDPNDWFDQAPTEYALWLACPPAGGMSYIEVAPDSDDPTKFVVTDIPASVPPLRVAQHLGQIMMVVSPDRLYWPAVADVAPGTILKTYRDGNAVRAPEMPHWTGGACIGWMAE